MKSENLLFIYTELGVLFRSKNILPLGVQGRQRLIEFFFFCCRESICANSYRSSPNLSFGGIVVAAVENKQIVI